MARWIKLAAFVFAFVLAIYLASYVSRLPEANCTTSSVSSLWSGDHVYKATLLKKDCNLGETVFYSVRVEKPDAWFLRVEIEEDPYPAQASEPAVSWDLHRLEIGIPAETFSGSIQHRVGDLSVVRTYVSPKP
jgi:hypothetical protein